MDDVYEYNQVPNATILIVEDHKSVRNGLRDWLGMLFPRCRFLEAGSGEEAVALVSDEPPDIVLMDIGLPQMNGVEATRRIKAVAPQVHVVILTIHDASEYEAPALKAGAYKYVSKIEMGTGLTTALRDLLSVVSDSNKAS